MKSLHNSLKWFLLIGLALATHWGWAQSKGSVEGKVVDGDSKKPVEFATVVLLNATDSAIVSGGMTDATGQFLIEATPGVYLVKAELLSYDEAFSNKITVSANQKTKIGTLTIHPSSEILSEVEVTGKKSTMEVGLDKKVFNVGEDMSSIGGSATDVLENIPSVTVDVDGNVNLRGSGNVRILINGRQSGLVGISSQEALQQLPSNLIERVEVVTNPSVRYDAEGMAGVINIILKKDYRQGLNGSVDVSVGHPDLHNASINLNWRKNKFNLFGSYGIRYRDMPGHSLNYRETYNGSDTTILDQKQDFSRKGLSHTARFGLEYAPDKYNTLTGSFLYRIGNDDNTSEIKQVNISPEKLSQKSLRFTGEEEEEPNFDYNLSYMRTFEQKGRELKADLQYSTSSETEISDIWQRYYVNDVEDPTQFEQEYSYNKEGQDNLTFQADYVHPISEKGKIEAGVKSSLRDINTNYYVDRKNEQGDWIRDDGLSNKFEYDEKIHAAYASFGEKFNRFSMQLGVRAEYTDYSTKLIETNEVNSKEYLSLFPTAHFTYDLTQNSSVQWSYSRRVQRPSFWSLNPFLSYTNRENIWTGNPALQPEFTNSFEIGFMQNWTKTSLTSSIYYRHTTDVIERLRQLNEDQTVTITKPENLNEGKWYGLELTASHDITSWWRADGSVNFFRNQIDGSNFGESYKTDTYAWFGRVNTKLDLPKDLNIQMIFNYRAPRETTQGKTKQMAFMDIALSKDILAKKGTLSLKVRDVFATRKYRSETFDDDFFVKSEYQRSTQVVQLGLTYRINQKKRKTDQLRNGGDFGGEGGM
ncbi:TonB-dependent receptor [Rapidithrix thailandica]|uniref:TonB-dependent receptor n=1 Tax=Rapidithrix thailandica TaxID=413964 RepID=A0AAW9RU77_9BACT